MSLSKSGWRMMLERVWKRKGDDDMESETNSGYDPKDWPETDICVYPVPEVQAQAADLVSEGVESLVESAMTVLDTTLDRIEETNGLQYVPVLGGDVKKPDYYRTLQDGT